MGMGGRGFYQFVHGSQAVDGRQGDDHKQISHFPDRNCFCPVTDDAEDSEQAQGKAYAHLHAAHDIQKHEHGRREYHKREIIVPAAAFAVIETMDQYPACSQVHKETDCQFGQGLGGCHHGICDGLYIQDAVIGKGIVAEVLCGNHIT